MPDSPTVALAKAAKAHELSRSSQLEVLRHSAERDRLVYAARQAGVGAADLAKELGVALQRVYAFETKGAALASSSTRTTP